MRVIETTAHIGSDGMLRLEVPLEQRNQEVRIALVVESSAAVQYSSRENPQSANDPWAAFRHKAAEVGLRLPAPGSWNRRQSEPLEFDGPSASDVELLAAAVAEGFTILDPAQNPALPTVD